MKISNILGQKCLRDLLRLLETFTSFTSALKTQQLPSNSALIQYVVVLHLGFPSQDDREIDSIHHCNNWLVGARKPVELNFESHKTQPTTEVMPDLPKGTF